MYYDGERVLLQPDGRYYELTKCVYMQDGQKYTLSATRAMELFGPALDAIVNGTANNYHAAVGWRGTEVHIYPVVFDIYGASTPVDTSYRMDFPTIRSSNQPAFANAKETGAIIVSAYQKGYIEVKPKPGYLYSRLGAVYERRVNAAEILGIPFPPTGSYYQYKGWEFVTLPTLIYKRQRCRITEAEQGNDFDPDLFMHNIMDGAKADHALITKAVADANGGTVDVATSLAELPQTMGSVLSGCIKILKMYKDAKRLDIRINDKVKKVRAEWNRELSRLENLKNKDHAALATARKQYAKDVNNLLHASASVWLTYRLEIYPTVKTVEALAEGLLLGDAFRKFVRFREFELKGIQTELGEVPCEFRTFIKRNIKPGEEWKSYFSSNMTRTAWELIPLSFVVDRYIAIGDWITANLSSPSRFTLDEGATLSWKIDTVVANSQVEVKVKFKKRIPFKTDDYCRLYFPPSRSSKQKLDHLALAWAILIKKV